MNNKKILSVAIALCAVLGSSQASAYSVTGNYGTSTSTDGVVTSPGSEYSWISTAGGVNGANGGLGGTDGSILTSDAFNANGGDKLHFNFNYVTSDGAGYADYAWSKLLDQNHNTVAWLFTARTTTSGNTVPGFGLPTNQATISSSVIQQGSAWSALGADSGKCYSTGCGHTGWVTSDYTIANAGLYYLEFGVANYLDTIYDSGLAFYGATIAGKSIDTGSTATPIPGAVWLFGTGLAGLIGANKRKKAAVTTSSIVAV